MAFSKGSCACLQPEAASRKVAVTMISGHHKTGLRRRVRYQGQGCRARPVKGGNRFASKYAALRSLEQPLRWLQAALRDRPLLRQGLDLEASWLVSLVGTAT